MLTDKARKHVESDWTNIPEDKRKDVLKVYRRRLRVQAIQTLTDLALVAEHEPEDQLKQMFTEQTLEPFLRLVTGDASEEITVRHCKIAKLMLLIAHERLKPQIPKAFRITSNRSLDDNYAMLDAMEIHQQKNPLGNVEVRREALRRQQQTILKQLYRNEREKKSGAEKK
ncbi:MAG TPA: hypothetical protein VE862_10060 [Candidatus Acidoferrum sp.]|nr:hypothetical protein [Candidatus Acidoferrum sp.]